MWFGVSDDSLPSRQGCDDNDNSDTNFMLNEAAFIYRRLITRRVA